MGLQGRGFGEGEGARRQKNLDYNENRDFELFFDLERNQKKIKKGGN